MVSILLIKVSRIGDTLFAIPAMRAIAAHYPNARLTVLGHRHRIAVLKNLPFIHHLGAISKKTAWLRGWYGQRYDYAIVYGFDASLVNYALRVAKRVVAFQQHNAALNQRLYRCVEMPTIKNEHAVLLDLRLTAALGVPPLTSRRLAYQVSPLEQHTARALLNRDIPNHPFPLIGVQIASFPTKHYRDWPLENFAALMFAILKEYPKAHFLIYGGAAEKSRTSQLKQQLGNHATLYAGRLTLRQTAAVMSLTNLYIGVDTGPSHIMSAFDIPLVGIYHCISGSHLTGPLDHPCFYPVDHPVTDVTCTENQSIAEISVAMVLNQVQQALKQQF